MFPADMFIKHYLKVRQPHWRWPQISRFGSPFLLIAALAAGCSHTPREADRTGAFEAFPTPLPPTFLNGPMALLLTNADGFHAHVVLENGGPAHALKNVTGELRVLGSKLMFAPAPDGVPRKQVHAEDSAFIWDVIESRGYVLNDPLQGYAPISSSRQFTNIVPAVVPEMGAPEKIAGHPCVLTEVTLTATDGNASVYRVWRARDLPGIPLRVTCPSNGFPVTLTLSKVRLETVPKDLFQPPNGFTKYESPEAMMAELFLRKHNLSRKKSFQSEDAESGTGFDGRPATRPN